MDSKTRFFERKQRELGIALNDTQKQAVLQTEGAVLLLASPGSGKTTTMIMRIGYLIEEKGVRPARIKAVTFSRASAHDMKERYRRFFPELAPVDFSTIHSLAYEVVREHFRRAGVAYQMIEGSGDAGPDGGEDPDQAPLHKKAILRQIFKSVTGENMTDDQMDELTTYISYIKNKLLPPERWGTVKAGVTEAERILREYEAFKRSRPDKLLLDFDDMLTLGNEILERDVFLLETYQRRYDYVLTDESQDTSLVQHAIIEKLVRGHGNLCVVADDDQSIYSWRGAEPAYLLNFRQVYPQAQILFMEQNYRSVPAIVDAANQFIRRNPNRYDKNMFTERPEEEKGGVILRSFPDYKAQTKYVIGEIQKTERLSEVAVLYRNNSSSVALINALDRAGIPFYMKDTDNRFFSHWVVEDILNFMRMTFTDKRPDILEKIHLKFNGYISKQQMAAVKEIRNNESVFDNLLQYVKLQDYQLKPLQASRDTFREMKGMPPLQAIRVIRERLGYEKALDKMCEWMGFRKEFLIGILNTLEEIAETLETMEDFARRLKVLESALTSSKKRRGEHAVTLSTFHSAKGLEFEKVFMIDLVDGVIPSSEDIKKHAVGEDAPMEEAVRLFYVGMTRAKRELELLTYQERDGEKTAESRFVSHVRSIVRPENDKAGAAGAGHSADSLAVAAGDAVRHRVFGRGEVRARHGDLVDIAFAEGTKTLSLHTCVEMGLLEREACE
ncbi:ATP-dependent helicase [Paenibacillus faecis]|uniref:ATP-dependent helicase n=1 Tax=Paenibacillus faecis TaxID=862114 RepID=UPI003B83A385